MRKKIALCSLVFAGMMAVTPAGGAFQESRASRRGIRDRLYCRLEMQRQSYHRHD